MNYKLINLFRCPIDAQTLRLHCFEKEDINAGQIRFTRVKEGLLINDRLNIFYPIIKYVPIMLRFTAPIHESFVKNHFSYFQENSNLKAPNLEPEIGEKDTQTIFSEEWLLTSTSELTFQRNESDLVNLNGKVWLHSLTDKKVQINNTLNVGCGIGGETLALNKIFSPKLLIAVDLNLALLASAEKYKDLEEVQFVICSLFHIPIVESHFDLVYSQGVLHHTFSTEEAFGAISKFVKKQAFLFVWVYALEDHLCFRNFFKTSFKYKCLHLLSLANWYLEAMFRPWLWRVPAIVRSTILKSLSLILHPLIRARVINKREWKLVNTEHSLRDTLTPRYAYRHSFNEVMEWYETYGFSIYSMQSPTAHRRLFKNKRIHGIGIVGQKISEQ